MGTAMGEKMSFNDYAIVSCGTMVEELRYLKDSGFLDARKILFTAPGLHENQKELERQLTKQLTNAAKYAHRSIVVYGERCFLDPSNPYRNIDAILEEKAPGAMRVRARSCIDMLADEQERNSIGENSKVYWLSPGWLIYWKKIFQEWDAAKANETFPMHDKAILLDPVGIFERYSADRPEDILTFSDWMGLEIQPYPVSLDRLKNLLLQGIDSQ
jgi:hypothetical protein